MPGTGGSDRQAVAVHIAVVGQHIDRHRGILTGGCHIRPGNRCIIHSGNRHGQHSCRHAAGTIADAISHGIGAVKVDIGDISQRAISVNGDGTMPSRCGGHRQTVAVHIAVVRQHIHRHRGVFRRGRGVVHRHRRVIDRGDGHRHRGRGGAAVAVADGIADSVAAVVVGRRGIGQGAVGVDHHRAVAGAGGGDRQAVAVHIAVVGQHIHRHLGVFQRGGGVVGRHRRVIDRGDGDRYRTRRAGAQSVTDLIGNGVAAVVVGRRRVGQRTVGVDHHRAVSGRRRRHGQRITISIGVIRQHVHRHRCIFRRGSAVRVGDRRRINVDGNGGGFRGAITGNGIGKRIITQITAIGGVDRVAGAINHHRTV